MKDLGYLKVNSSIWGDFCLQSWVVFLLMFDVVCCGGDVFWLKGSADVLGPVRTLFFKHPWLSREQTVLPVTLPPFDRAVITVSELRLGNGSWD